MDTACAQDRARLAELEHQIQELERTLAALRLEECAVKDRLNAYKYPVLSLPHEIVAEIFLRFIPAYPACPPLAGSESPVLLTHICRMWRETALATPRLWRAVCLSAMERASFNPNYIWLNRAGCCPLSIRLNERDSYALSGPALAAAIAPHRARCEYLKIRLAFQGAVPAIEGEFSILHHLDLELDVHLSKTVVFDTVPMLRSAVLDFIASRWIVLPWTQLTTLWLHTLTLPECVPILPKAENLVECHLDLVARLRDKNFVVDPCITLTRLQSLTVHAENSMTRCLDSFSLPALFSLDICEVLLGTDPVSSLSAFATRSQCSLRQLCIRSTHSSPLTEDAYCAAFPSIQSCQRIRTDGYIYCHE
ncbi:F-box domain-containing protein [Favolaschia claudopus]|uniref:F-box domain-containing protein n=1 Tax=Favolaschia claudopus TaxID=2862362 RepID=A0AAW0AY09_9AGAR